MLAKTPRDLDLAGGRDGRGESSRCVTSASDVAVRMFDLVIPVIAAAAGFLVGWIVGFLNRRGHTRRVRDKLQAEVSRLEELMALERMREYVPPRPGTESALDWMAAIPHQGPASTGGSPARSSPTRPQRTDSREGA